MKVATEDAELHWIAQSLFKRVFLWYYFVVVTIITRGPVTRFKHQSFRNPESLHMIHFSVPSWKIFWITQHSGKKTKQNYTADFWSFPAALPPKGVFIITETTLRSAPSSPSSSPFFFLPASPLIDSSGRLAANIKAEFWCLSEEKRSRRRRRSGMSFFFSLWQPQHGWRSVD